jgi:hypothetical protein
MTVPYEDLERQRVAHGWREGETYEAEDGRCFRVGRYDDSGGYWYVPVGKRFAATAGADRAVTEAADQAHVTPSLARELVADVGRATALKILGDWDRLAEWLAERVYAARAKRCGSNE